MDARECSVLGGGYSHRGGVRKGSFGVARLCGAKRAGSAVQAQVREAVRTCARVGFPGTRRASARATSARLLQALLMVKHLIRFVIQLLSGLLTISKLQYLQLYVGTNRH